MGGVLLNVASIDHLAHQLCRDLIILRRVLSYSHTGPELCQLVQLVGRILFAELRLLLYGPDLCLGAAPGAGCAVKGGFCASRGLYSSAPGAKPGFWSWARRASAGAAVHGWTLA